MEKFILVCIIAGLALLLCGISIFITLHIKMALRSCKRCSHYKGGKCDIITLEDINNLNKHYECGVFEYGKEN